VPTTPSFFAALHFGDGVIDVVHRDQSDAVRTIRYFLAVFNNPVVVGAEQGLLQPGILDAKQAQSQAGIEHFCGNAVGHHIALPFDRIPTAGTCHGKTRLAKLFEILRLLTGHEQAAHGLDLHLGRAKHPSIALLVKESFRRTVFKCSGHALFPKIRHFDDVRVRRND